MASLTQAQVKKYKEVDRRTQAKIISVAKLLHEISPHFDRYSNQRKADIDRGMMKVGSVYVPLKTGKRDLFEQHYPLTYIENMAVLLEHMNRTDSAIAKWLLMRTILETVYRYARISVIADTSDKKIVRFRALTVLDFHLHLASVVNTKHWIDEYFDLLDSFRKRTSTFISKDFEIFPQSRRTLSIDNNEELRRERVKHLINLASGFFLMRPAGYKEVYSNTSQLIHGNPFQTSMARKLQGQWRERFLIHGLTIKSCDDLLQTIANFSDIKDKKLVTKIQKNSAELQKFFLDTLKPTWAEAARTELTRPL